MGSTVRPKGKNLLVDDEFPKAPPLRFGPEPKRKRMADLDTLGVAESRMAPEQFDSMLREEMEHGYPDAGIPPASPAATLLRMFGRALQDGGILPLDNWMPPPGFFWLAATIQRTKKPGPIKKALTAIREDVTKAASSEEFRKGYDELLPQYARINDLFLDSISAALQHEPHKVKGGFPSPEDPPVTYEEYKRVEAEAAKGRSELETQLVALLAPHLSKVSKPLFRGFVEGTVGDIASGLDSLLVKAPAYVPYYTAPEINELTRGIFDAQTGENWEDMEGEISLLHQSDRKYLRTKFSGGPMLQWWNFELSHGSLRAILSGLGPDAVLVLHTCLRLAATNDRVTIEIDELIKALGATPRSVAQRAELRNQIWRWMTCFANMAIIGVRPGKFRDNLTRKELELTSRDPLIAITGTREPIQQALDGSEAPTEISFVAGDWLSRFKGNSQVLTYLGNATAIAGIPGGQPSGKWARTYAQALHQIWREQASKSHSPPIVTREQLHRLCPRKPGVHDVLKGDNPRRAIAYDKQAWGELSKAGIIAPNQKLAYEPAKRQYWQDEFLNQPLRVVPGPSIAQELGQIPKAIKQAPKKNR